MNEHEILAGILRRFFWNPPNIVEVHTETPAPTLPFIFIHGQVDLTESEVDFLKWMHSQHVMSTDLDDARTYEALRVPDNSPTLHELADEPERSIQ